GVYGQVEDGVLVPNRLRAGVFGASTTQPGTIGFSQINEGAQGLSFAGFGMKGRSDNNIGVLGLSNAAPGVHGRSDQDSGVVGLAGTWGPQLGMNLPTIAGVVGTADQRPGVIGTSNALIGVYGFSPINAGIVGETANPASFAGYFAGKVQVTGDLHVAGQIFAGVKDAIVPFPDGSKRVLHCMESPEHWFEDFGTARLKRGRALVKLDADFAKVIKRGDYHVFLTSRGDCRGLYVRRQGGLSFEVRELAGGKSSVAFSYRIVGHRKDIKRHKRFAKIDTGPSLSVATTRVLRKRQPSLRAFIAELEREARAKATSAMRKSDSEVAAMAPG